MDSMKKNFIQRAVSARGMRQVIGAFLGLIALMIVFSLFNKNFASSDNLLSLLRQIVPFLLVGIGQAYVCITGNIDLSIGAVVGMSDMITATLTCNGWNPWLACLVALSVCLCTGAVNGYLVGKFRLPPFIATLGTMMVGRGIAQIVNGNYNTTDIGEASAGFRDVFYYGKFFGISTVVWIALIVWFVFNYYLSYTKSGRHIYAVGSNTDAARLSGINVLSTTTKAYMVSAFAAWMTGLVVLSSSGMGSMEAGMTYEMYAVAAAVIGGVSTLGGSGLLSGVIVGAAIWAVLQNGLTFMNAPVAIRNIIIGVIVVACVLSDVVLRSARPKKI